MRTRHSLRASIIYKGPVQLASQRAPEDTAGSAHPQPPPAASRQGNTAEGIDGAADGSRRQKFGFSLRHSAILKTHVSKVLNLMTGSGQATPDSLPIGRCKALYSFTSEHSDELKFKEGWSSTERHAI